MVQLQTATPAHTLAHVSEKAINNQWAQFNKYLVLKLHLQIKFKDCHRSNKILNS